MALALPDSLTWNELFRRTAKDSMEDDLLGLAAQLAYYFFLALFPALLFILAVASYFPIENLADEFGRLANRFVSPAVSELVQDQMRRLANAESGGLLTFGVLGALWSSSAAIVSIVGALNRAYDIDEGRPWWKVRLLAIGLTLGVAIFVLAALTLVLAGPSLAQYLGRVTGFGAAAEWASLILQWPVALALVSMALGLIYYFAPDAEQDWAWVTPGALIGTALWLIASLAFRLYISHFTDYNAAYGTIGGVIVLMLWFYVSGIALLIGAEVNAEIEHASPYGKDKGQKSPAGKRLLGQRAARAYEEEQRLRAEENRGAPDAPRRHLPAAGSPSPGLAFAAGLWIARAIRARMRNGHAEVHS
jgi:membrane protein